MADLVCGFRATECFSVGFYTLEQRLSNLLAVIGSLETFLFFGVADETYLCKHGWHRRADQYDERSLLYAAVRTGVGSRTHRSLNVFCEFPRFIRLIVQNDFLE